MLTMVNEATPSVAAATLLAARSSPLLVLALRMEPLNAAIWGTRPRSKVNFRNTTFRWYTAVAYLHAGRLGFGRHGSLMLDRCWCVRSGEA